MAPRMTVDEIIRRTVIAQAAASERQAKDVFRATEKRLYAYPVIKLKIEDDRERIEELKQHGAPGKNRSILKYQRSGVRLSSEEIAEGLTQDLTAQIAESEQEIETIDKALDIISGDDYADVIKYKYFEGKSDEEIAELISCADRTVRYNKSRLVKRLSVFLYGVAGIY